MRVHKAAMLGLCAVGLACTIRPNSRPFAADASPEPAAPGDNTIAGSPGGDPCAAYVERAAPGVRCQAIDATRCTCELIADTSDSAPPVDPAPASASAASPAAPAAGPVATLEFASGPQSTIVQCLSGPCPTRSADFITSVYPPIPIPAEGASIQLEFRAPRHKPFVSTYNLVPGRNPIQFTLEREFGAPTSASFQFQGAPPGTVVECVSGPCADNKPHPSDSFPDMPLNDDGATLLLRFNAPGYRTAMTSFQVQRGPNSVPVLMEKAPLGK